MGSVWAQKYGVTVASGVTLSSGIDLSRAYAKLSLEVPTMASGTDVYLQVSSDNSTFRRLYHAPVAGTTTPPALVIPSSVTNCIVPVSVAGVRYVKIELSTAMTATSAQFNLIASD